MKLTYGVTSANLPTKNASCAHVRAAHLCCPKGCWMIQIKIISLFSPHPTPPHHSLTSFSLQIRAMAQMHWAGTTQHPKISPKRHTIFYALFQIYTTHSRLIDHVNCCLVRSTPKTSHSYVYCTHSLLWPMAWPQQSYKFWSLFVRCHRSLVRSST